jgi:hypothetical protein
MPGAKAKADTTVAEVDERFSEKVPETKRPMPPPTTP